MKLLFIVNKILIFQDSNLKYLYCHSQLACQAKVVRRLDWESTFIVFIDSSFKRMTRKKKNLCYFYAIQISPYKILIFCKLGLNSNFGFL